MALPAVDSEFYPTPSELHAMLLSRVRYGYANAGIPVNVKPKSELWNRMLAVAEIASIAIQNGKLRLADTDFLTVTGDALLRLCAIFGVAPRPASASLGFVLATVLSGQTVTVPAAFRATSATGIIYETPTSFPGTTNNAPTNRVKLVAVNKGPAGDLAAGAILTWNSASVGYLGQKCIVAAGGIDGGAPADTDDTLRARLLRRLRLPPVGGNPSHVASFAETASAAVRAAFVYPTLRGPSSYDLAILGPSDDIELGDDVVDVVNGTVLAEMPGCEDLNGTAITEEPIDVVLDVSLPLPRFAGGEGGGWLDAEPWPSTDETGVNVFARVTAASAGSITVNSTSDDPPVAGKHIAVWSTTIETMRPATIVNVTGGSGAYVLTLDTLTTIASVGDHVSAASERLNDYAAAFVAACRALGPGEKTDNPDILVYARRRPPADVEFPWALTSRILSAIEAEFAEVSDLSYGGRFTSGTYTTQTSPSVPANTADPPFVLSPYRLSFRRQT